MIVVYCSAIACADFIMYRLYASHSSPLRTARKDDRKVILFLFYSVWSMWQVGASMR